MKRAFLVRKIRCPKDTVVYSIIFACCLAFKFFELLNNNSFLCSAGQPIICTRM